MLLFLSLDTNVGLVLNWNWILNWFLIPITDLGLWSYMLILSENSIEYLLNICLYSLLEYSQLSYISLISIMHWVWRTKASLIDCPLKESAGFLFLGMWQNSRLSSRISLMKLTTCKCNGLQSIAKILLQNCTNSVVMCVPFGRPTNRWQRPGRHNWAVMGELTFLYI